MPRKFKFGPFKIMIRAVIAVSLAVSLIGAETNRSSPNLFAGNVTSIADNAAWCE
jgi:hypothetical protein